MLFISKLDGKLSCSEHDPCGPDPLEPGEIREYVPNMTSVRPRNMPTPDSMVPQSKSSSLVPSLPAEHRPPPRLYINTKTATSSFVPFNRSYLTDDGDGKPVSSSAEEREDGEVEDGEVCQFEEEDEDDDDDEEDDEEEEDDDETGEMEIVEDEEDQFLYGENLLEDDNREETEDGRVYDGWSDYVDEDEDGEVEEDDDDDEWRMVVDEDK